MDSIAHFLDLVKELEKGLKMGNFSDWKNGTKNRPPILRAVSSYLIFRISTSV